MPSRRPWLRLYTAWRTDPRVQGLPYWVQAAAINLLCLAGENTRQGFVEMSLGVPYPPPALAKALNIHGKDLEKFLNHLRNNGVFGLKTESNGVQNLTKWSSNQPADPTAQERMAHMRQKGDTRNDPVTEVSQERNNTVTVTGQSRVEEDKNKNKNKKGYSSAEPFTDLLPPGASPTSLEDWVTVVKEATNQVGLLGKMVAQLTGQEINLSRLASILGKVYNRDAPYMASKIWSAAESKPVGDFLSYVEKAKGGDNNIPPGGLRGFEEDAAKCERWTSDREEQR